MNTDKLLEILLEAIDYSFLQTNGDYDKSLTYPVIDKVRYIKEKLKNKEVKEVDLEKEIETHLKECLDVKFPTTDIELIKKDVEYTARMFFELGLKAQKEE